MSISNNLTVNVIKLLINEFNDELPVERRIKVNKTGKKSYFLSKMAELGELADEYEEEEKCRKKYERIIENAIKFNKMTFTKVLRDIVYVGVLKELKETFPPPIPEIPQWLLEEIESNLTSPPLPTTPCPNGMRVLELFSGTGSIGKVCEERGYEVISLDLTLPATINEDIMTWDYKSAYPIGHFDLITASPVCLYWSKLRHCHIGRGMTKETIQKDINEKGKPMVDKTREIIDYFNPRYYWIENPQSSKMKDYIIDLTYYDVDYCMYGFPYQKRTRFWSNIKGFVPKLCKKDCGNIVDGTKRHTKTLGNGYGKDKDGNTILINTKEKRKLYKNLVKDNTNSTTKYERYRIPPILINELLDIIH